MGWLAHQSNFSESIFTECSASQVNAQDQSCKWKVGKVLWKLAEGQETKDSSKKPKRLLIVECLREWACYRLCIIYIKIV